MRVLVTGDRKWSDRDIVWKVLDELLEKNGEVFLIEGGASGADAIALDWRRWQEEQGAPVDGRTFPAKWRGVSDKGVSYYNPGAGPTRNQQMLDEGKPEFAVAFHDDLEGRSKGTLDMVKKLRKAKIKHVVVSHSTPEPWLSQKPVTLPFGI